MSHASGPGFISLQVRDVDASAAFYETYLGFTRQAGPPHAVVFDTKPASFAVRSPLPGVDLDAVSQLGLGIGVSRTGSRSRPIPSTGRSVAPSRSPTPTATGLPSTAVREPRVPSLETVHLVDGPWSLTTSRRFWEGFAPAALAAQPEERELRTAFLVDADWRRSEAVISQEDDAVRIVVSGVLDAATTQVRRFLSVDIDGRGWPDVGNRDPIVADAQRRLPGLRPCGFFSPYEAAAWAVLSQRVAMRQAAGVKRRLTDEHGDRGAFPAPAVLLGLDLDLPGRKSEYLHAVAEAALNGVFSGERLRSLDPDEALRQVQGVTGLGPFAAELVVIRGANSPDVLPRSEKRLEAEIVERYGTGRSMDEITDVWRPFRSWAAVHLRALREERTHEIATGRSAGRG